MTSSKCAHLGGRTLFVECRLWGIRDDEIKQLITDYFCPFHVEASKDKVLPVAVNLFQKKTDTSWEYNVIR